MPKGETGKPAVQSVREKQLNVRIDADLLDEAADKAAPYGLGPVIRAFLRAFVKGSVELPPDELLRELVSARRGRVKGKPAKRAKD
jgi:hypothetical protein